MTATLDAEPLRSRGESRDAAIVSLDPPKRRRPSWVLVGAIVVGLSALLGAYVFNSATDTLSVTVAARDLDPGEVVSAGDLRVVEMGYTDGLRAIQPSQQDLIIGLAPLGPIPEGTMLNTGLFVSSDSVVPEGMVVVGSSLSAGAVPTPSLDVTDEVVLLASSVSAVGVDAETAVAKILGEGSVWSVEGTASTSGMSDRVWVSLLVDESIQADVVQAAADDRLRLALAGS